MPPVIIGIAVGVAAAGVVTVGAAIAIGVAAAAFSYAMMPSVSAPSFSNEAYAQQQMLRSPAEARRGIYGRSMVSGPLIFVEETGTDNEYLHLVIALAGHRCDAIEEVYFGDDLAWTPATGMKGKYRNNATVRAHLGDQTTADSTLVSQCRGWTDKHIGHDVTYLYVRLKHNNDVFPNGVPNIKALVKGKRVYDPRLDSSAGGNGSHRLDDDSTREWSENWALCVLDYTCFESGVGALPSEVDFASYAGAANDSDQQVEYQSDEFERRYCCNGTYKQDTSPASVLEKLLSAGAGMQVYVGGKYHLYAGVYQGPAAITLSEDDCAGEIDVRPYTPRASLCNAVRGTFVDPDNFYQPTDFSPYESAYYRDQDNDEYIDHDLDLPFTQSNWAAQRLAKLHLEMNRAGMQITFPCKMIGLAVSVGTVVQLQLPELGIDGTFMVADWVFDYGKPVKLILRESTPAIFNFAMGSYTQRDLASNTYLPNPSNVPTVRNLVWQELGDDANWQGVLSWSAPGENSSYRYRLEVTSTTGDLVYQANPDIPRHHIPKLDAGSYNISLWAVNMFANRSNVAAMLSIGASAPPPITGIEVIAGPLELLLRPNTSAFIANTTEFELRGSLANDFGGTSVLGQGKEVIWPSRNPNTSHYIWARCVNNFGNSAWFGPVLAQTSDDPTAIVNLIESEIGVRLGAYTWFAWADDAAGTGFTTDKTNSQDMAFIGVANEKQTATPSGNWQDYTWSRMKAEASDLFTPGEEAALDNLMAGKLPTGNKDLLALQDALNNSSLSNDLLAASNLLNQGITALALGGETPAGAQAKADAAKAAAEAYALAKANLAEITANIYADGQVSAEETRAIADAQSKADAAKNVAISTAAADAQAKVNAIKIGGTNLAANSKVNTSSTAYGFMTRTAQVKAGETYTFSLSGRVTQKALDEGHYLRGYVYYPSWSFSKIIAITSLTDVTLSVTFVAPESGLMYLNGYCFPGSAPRTGTVHTNWYKLEVGNKATDWSPAPEDNEVYAAAKADLAEVKAKAYADGEISKEEARAIADAQAKADAAKNLAISTAASDASTKAYNAQVAAETYASSKANLAEVKAKAYADGQVSAEESRAIADAQTKADAAKNAAIASANSALDSRVSSSNATSLQNLLTKSGLPFYKRLMIYGDSNKYYPVIVFGGDQNRVRNIKIWRSFNEHGPDDWNVPTHKGSLMMHWSGNFGGWGGASYKEHLVQNASAYTILIGDCFRTNHSMAYCFMIRGGGPGGATYHYASDQDCDVQAYYNQELTYDSSNNNYDVRAPAPITEVKIERLTYLSLGNVSITNLLAYSAQFNNLKAKLASFGGLTANELFVDTALITKLVGTSALFNQLIAQMGTFGGLTANAIAADAIEGRHFKANQLIESPVIQGGEFRLIGTGFMKVMRATAFGPDSLVEWYGPKLLSGTTPNWNELKKSNAITYLSADGDAYFGGTLSAGVLKNGIATSDKNPYLTNSYPVIVGPFGSNGKRKSVIVSFSYAGYSSTGSNPGNVTQPALSWQLQRKIGSGSWAAVSSGTFTGTVRSEYDGESRQYFVSEFCSGSSTYVDNSTSSSDFNYRIKVASTRRYHATSNVNNQVLSLYSTEQ